MQAQLFITFSEKEVKTMLVWHTPMNDLSITLKVQTKQMTKFTSAVFSQTYLSQYIKLLQYLVLLNVPNIFFSQLCTTKVKHHDTLNNNLKYFCLENSSHLHISRQLSILNNLSAVLSEFCTVYTWIKWLLDPSGPSCSKHP